MPVLTEEQWKEAVQEAKSDKDYYGLIGIMYAEGFPGNLKNGIISFLVEQGQEDVLKDLGEYKEIPTETEQWMERWHKRSWRIKGQPELPEQFRGWDQPTSPIFCKNYYPKMREFYSEHSPELRTDKERDQQAFIELVTMIIPKEKRLDLNYLEQIAKTSKEAGFDVQVPMAIKHQVTMKEESEAARKEEERIKTQQQEQEKREGKPLEQQLAEAIAEERYEDADKIQKELNKLKKLTGGGEKYKGTLHLGDLNE